MSNKSQKGINVNSAEFDAGFEKGFEFGHARGHEDGWQEHADEVVDYFETAERCGVIREGKLKKIIEEMDFRHNIPFPC